MVKNQAQVKNTQPAQSALHLSIPILPELCRAGVAVSSNCGSGTLPAAPGLTEPSPPWLVAAAAGPMAAVSHLCRRDGAHAPPGRALARQFSVDI